MNYYEISSGGDNCSRNGLFSWSRGFGFGDSGGNSNGGDFEGGGSRWEGVSDSFVCDCFSVGDGFGFGGDEVFISSDGFLRSKKGFGDGFFGGCCYGSGNVFDRFSVKFSVVVLGSVSYWF